MAYEELLGSAKTARGKINMVAIIVAFVLAIININTYRQCDNNLKSGTPSSKTFEDGNIVKLGYAVSVVIVILCVLFFSYDVFSMMM